MNVTGQNGELIGHFADAVRGCVVATFEEVAICLALYLGGRDLASVHPDSGRPPAPGTVGEKMAREYTLVDQPTFADLLERRLAALVNGGMDEAFLVAALQDALTEHFAHLTDTQGANARRAAQRDAMLRHADDPKYVERWHARLIADDPSFASRTVEEMADELRALAEKLDPVSLESEAGVWAVADDWRAVTRETLSRDAIESWRVRRAVR